MYESYSVTERFFLGEKGREGINCFQYATVFSVKCLHLDKTETDYVLLLFWQGPTEFTETLNRITVVTLAIIIKTRGIADADHLHYLQTMLEQILVSSNHTWSEKTLRYFPSLLRDFLIPRTDNRGIAIQAWQQVHCWSPLILFCPFVFLVVIVLLIINLKLFFFPAVKIPLSGDWTHLF